MRSDFCVREEGAVLFKLLDLERREHSSQVFFSALRGRGVDCRNDRGEDTVQATERY
jgi:hypothetical protein